MVTKQIRKLKGLNRGELIWFNEKVSIMQQEHFLRQAGLCETDNAKTVLNNEMQDGASVDGEMFDFNDSHEVQHYVFIVEY